MESSLYKSQYAFRPNGQRTCMHHRGKQLDLHCKKCQELVCTKCLSTLHENHLVCGLDAIVPKKKASIQNFIDTTEKENIAQIDQYIASTEEHLKENTNIFCIIADQIKAQNDKLKEELDLLSAETLSLYKQMEESNAKLLQTYKQDLEKYGAELKLMVQECKKALQKGNDVEIYDTGCTINFYAKLPAKPTFGDVCFTPNPKPRQHLKKAFGETDASHPVLNQTSSEHNLKFDSSTEERPSTTSLKSSKKGKSSVKISKREKEGSRSEYSLISKPSKLDEWWSPCYITSLCSTSDGPMWSSFYSTTVTLLDEAGKNLQEVEHTSRIWNISFSSSSKTLWACDCDGNILEVVSGRLRHRFHTRQKPECICITAGNEVLVGMGDHVSKFTTRGELLCTTLASGSGIPIVGSPYRISECPVTQYIAVVDLNHTYGGVSVKPRIVVMNKNFKERFTYSGEVPGESTTPRSQSKTFYPSNVVYDSKGNIIIGDCKNDRILLMTGNCQFIKILHTDSHSTFAVDRRNVLWTISGVGNVKLLKYYK
ncbi:uncharacterized protein [Argopecten irradians]|uniref:uncharacterized protein n=1 Tax=Argopecten irradians TaxID=31199 RepID=UPI0037112C21